MGAAINWYEQITQRHKKSANFLFMPGYVKTVPERGIPYKNNAAPGGGTLPDGTPYKTVFWRYKASGPDFTDWTI